MPLELRLVRLNGSSKDNLKPYAIFGGEESKKITDLKDLILEKQKQKSANQPESKKIIDDPIVLTIYSPDVPNLSLVDLPGITKNAIGDQDKNIEKITKDMARRYIKVDRTIILCVTPANVDLATSDSIQMAQEQEIDPLGERTLGVITMIDLMNQGTNALKILTNNEFPLKHGYIAVKNRSPKDIKDGMLVKAALKNEEEWFSNHNVYRSYPLLWGSKRLSERLSELLSKQIVNSLPDIKKEISKTLTKADGDLQTLGDPLPQEEGMKFYYFSKLIDTLESYVEKESLERFLSVKILVNSKELLNLDL